MSALEGAPAARESIEEERTPIASLDALTNAAGQHDLAVVAEDLRAQQEVLATFPPEKRAAATIEIRERTKVATNKLRRLRIAAALATTLLAMGPEETAAAHQEPITAEHLAENPERLESLLEGMLLSIEKEQEAGARPELAPLGAETNDVLRRIQDGHTGGGKYGALALRVGETAFRALASAAGFGLGVAGYDIIKEIAKATRERRA